MWCDREVKTKQDQKSSVQQNRTKNDNAQSRKFIQEQKEKKPKEGGEWKFFEVDTHKLESTAEVLREREEELFVFFKKFLPISN
jgi:hypothetical protein